MKTRYFALWILLAGCSSDEKGKGGNATMGSGGVGVSGASGSSGSSVVAGGSANVGSGGATSMGGTAAGNGGAVGGGGTAGKSSTGGSVATGGASQGGQGGGDPGQVSRSAGCGMPAPMMGSTTIDVGGTMRQYILALPANYDPAMAYRLVFAWHGLGGSAQQVASNWYGLRTQSMNSVIFVAGQGLMTSTSVGAGAGWANTNGQDVTFVKALYAKLQGQLCFDQNRVFSVGMSYGGIMSDTLGCQMGDVFRAIAPMSGAGPRGQKCTGQVAVWMSNGDNDTVVPTASERESRDYWVSANHCQMQSMPVDPSPCVAYQGCDAGNPVTWCEFMGGHTVPSFAAAAIWKFFSQF